MNEINKDAWREAKEAERKQLNELQKSAIAKAVSSGEELAKYLAGWGRLGSRFSSGNAALILAQNPSARVVKPLEEWGSYGRRVSRGERGIQIIGRENGYWRVLRVFELCQTYGPRPYMIPRLANSPEKLKAALDTLAAFSPVQIVEVEQAEMPARYDPQTNEIKVNAAATQEEVFGPLAAAIVTANICVAEEAAEPSPVAVLYGQSAAAELCGRYGLEAPKDTAQKLEALLPCFVPGEERAMLDEIRSFARAMGGEIEKEVFPPDRGRGRMLSEPVSRTER